MINSDDIRRSWRQLSDCLRLQYFEFHENIVVLYGDIFLREQICYSISCKQLLDDSWNVSCIYGSGIFFGLPKFQSKHLRGICLSYANRCIVSQRINVYCLFLRIYIHAQIDAFDSSIISDTHLAQIELYDAFAILDIYSCSRDNDY